MTPRELRSCEIALSCGYPWGFGGYGLMWAYLSLVLDRKLTNSDKADVLGKLLGWKPEAVASVLHSTDSH